MKDSGGPGGRAYGCVCAYDMYLHIDVCPYMDVYVYMYVYV